MRGPTMGVYGSRVSHKTYLPLHLKYTWFTTLESALIAYLLVSSDKALSAYYAVECIDLPVVAKETKAGL